MKFAADILKTEAGYEAKGSGPEGGDAGGTGNAGGPTAAAGAPGAEDPKKGAAPEGAAGGAPAAGSAPDDDVPDEDEATLLKKLAKKGIKVASLNDIKPQEGAPAAPTAEELRQQKEDREAQIRMYGLRNKLVTSTDLDNFAADNQRPYGEVAFEAWVQDEYGDVPEGDRPSQEDLADEFNEAHYQYAKEDDPKRIRAEKKLQKIAQAHLKQKYAHVYSLESGFNTDQENSTLRSSYTQNVDQALGAIGDKLTFEVREGKETHTYDFKLLPADIAEAKEKFLGDGSFNLLKSTAKDDLINAIKAGLLTKKLQQAISYVSSTHARKMVEAAQKGLRGIPVVPDGSPSGDQSGAQANSNPIMKRKLDEGRPLVAN